MQLLCPLCQNMLTIDDKYAGMVLTCQLCSGKFQAPTLPDVPQAAPPPTPPTPAPPPVSPPFSSNSTAPASPAAAAEPAAPTPSTSAQASPPPPPPPTEPPSLDSPPSPPLPPLADGYTHLYVISFNRQVISLIPVIGLGLIFVLSFFPWISQPTGRPKGDTSTMWTTEVVPFLLYNLIFFPTVFVAVLAMLLDKKIIGLPDPFKKMRRFRSLIVAGLAAVGLFVLLIHWASKLNFSTYNPNTVFFSIVLFLQFVVVLAALLEYWLQQRKKNELPLPRIEMRW